MAEVRGRTWAGRSPRVRMAGRTCSTHQPWGLGVGGELLSVELVPEVELVSGGCPADGRCRGRGPGPW